MNDTLELEASLKALRRWKWLVLLVALGAGLATAAVQMAAAPRYSTSTLIRVGRVMDKEIDDVYAVAEMMDGPGFRAAMRERAGGPLTGSIDATALTGGQGRLEHPIMIRLTATAPTAQEAVAVGQAAVDELIARHKALFDKSIVGWREYEKVLAATGEPVSGPADAEARRQLFELRAKLSSPVTTSETASVDPLPTPTAPAPKNTLVSAAVASAATLAILILFVVAFAQVDAARGATKSP